jgi:hypothetical protein
MKTLLYSLAAATLTAFLATSAFAEPNATPKTTVNIQTGTATVATRTATPATRINNRRFLRATYHVHGYRGWTAYCWFPQYQCYGYYSAADGLWYYWYAPLNRYQSIALMAQYPPTPIGVGLNSPVAGTPGLPVTPGTASTLPSGALPPGATTVPTGRPGATVPPSGTMPPGDPMTPPPQ